LTTSVFEQVRTIASDLFGVRPEALTPASSSETVEQWDSAQHLSFVLALEEAFRLQLSPEEIDRIRTIGDAVKLVEEKLPTASG
jgi:acyl carrier protein